MVPYSYFGRNVGRVYTYSFFSFFSFLFISFPWPSSQIKFQYSMPSFCVGILFVVVVVILESGDGVLGWFSSSSSSTTIFICTYLFEWVEWIERERLLLLLQLGVITQPWEGFTILLPSSPPHLTGLPTSSQLSLFSLCECAHSSVSVQLFYLMHPWDDSGWTQQSYLTISSFFFVFSLGSSKLHRTRRDSWPRVVVGQTRTAGRSGLCATHLASSDGHFARGRPSHLPQWSSISLPHG